MKIHTRDMILAALFAALTAIGAKANLLLPDIPVTFQPIIVMLAGCLLGSRAALLSQLVYILTGLIGIPVFAKPMAGPAYILTPSFGYLIGFTAGAYVIGLIVEKSRRKNLKIFLAANFSGLFIIYFFGIAYLYLLMNLYFGVHTSIMEAVSIGAGVLIIKDIALGVVVSFMASAIYSRIMLYLRSF